MNKRLFLLVLIAILIFPMGAWAQESRAVLAIELGEGDELERVDSEIVAAIVAAYELELGWTMTQQEMQATLSTGQILAGDSAKIQSLVSGLQRGEDAFYEASPKAAEMLEEATQKALSQPMLLTLDKRLAEQSKNALLVLARAYLGEARFDEAAQTTTRMVESFPTYIPSRHSYPPKVVDLVEQSRSQHALTAKSLVITGAGEETCTANINGESIILSAQEERVSLNTAAYGLMLACGDHEAGPFLMNVSRVEKNLKISAQVVATMAALQAEEPLSFADGDIMAHRSTYELLRTLLDLDALVLVGESGAGLTVVKLSDEGLRGARLSGADPEDMVLMIDVIERGLPLGEIEYYEEGLWHQSSDKSYLAEIIVMSVGGASALTGVVFLALASSQSDVVDECRETGACDDANAQENLDYYATDLFVGEVLLGVGATMVFVGGTVMLTRMLSGGEESASWGQPQLAFGEDSAYGAWTWSW